MLDWNGSGPGLNPHKNLNLFFTIPICKPLMPILPFLCILKTLSFLLRKISAFTSPIYLILFTYIPIMTFHNYLGEIICIILKRFLYVFDALPFRGQWNVYHHVGKHHWSCCFSEHFLKIDKLQSNKLSRRSFTGHFITFNIVWFYLKRQSY